MNIQCFSCDLVVEDTEADGWQEADTGTTTLFFCPTHNDPDPEYISNDPHEVSIQDVRPLQMGP